MSVIATKVTNARRINPDLDKWENRGTEHGLFEATVSDTANLINAPGLSEDRQNFDRLVEIPVFNRHTATISNTRVCEPVGDEAVSALQGLTWNTISVSISERAHRFKGNEKSKEETFAHLLNGTIRDVRSEIENTIDTVLDGAKTQNLLNDLNAFIPFNTTNDLLEVPQAQKNRMFDLLKEIGGQNDFGDNYNFVHSYGVGEVVNFYRNQGSANSENTAYQFDNLSFYRSNRVTNTGNQGTFYFMPPGSVGIVMWVDPQSKMGGNVGTGSKIGEFGTTVLPGLGTVGSYITSGCVDDSAYTPGATRVEETIYNFTFDYAIVTPYTSNIAANVNPIMKGVLQN